MKRRLVFQVSGFTALLLLLAAAPSQAQTSSVTEEQARLQCMQQLASADLSASGGLIGLWAGADVPDLDGSIETCVQNVLKAQSLAQVEEQRKQYAANLKTQQCTAASQGLQSKGQLSNVQTLVKNDCAILYTMKWLTGGTGKANPAVCQSPWGAIGKAKVVKFAWAYVALRCGQ